MAQGPCQSKSIFICIFKIFVHSFIFFFSLLNVLFILSNVVVVDFVVDVFSPPSWESGYVPSLSFSRVLALIIRIVKN